MTLKDKCNQAILNWGIYPFSIVLKDVESQEKFEVCEVMFSVLKEHCKKYNIEIPKVDKYFKEDYMQAFWELGYSGDVANINLPFYVEACKNYLES